LRFDAFRRAVRGDLQFHFPARLRRALDLCAGAKFDTCFLHRFFKLDAHFFVFFRQEMGQGFEHCNIRAV